MLRLLRRLMPFLAVSIGSIALIANAQPPIDRIKTVIQAAIDQGQLPGCVIVYGSAEQVILQAAYGQRAIEPTPEAMSIDTIFDLASLTKAVSTATLIATLIADGRLDVDTTVATYLPQFTGGGKEAITVADLLTHRSGLIADNALEDYRDGWETAWPAICSLETRFPPGEDFIYSDVGYLVLGRLAEHVAGRPLDELFADSIAEPLHMRDAGYRPDASLRSRIAPTERRGEQWLRGDVHDPRAAALGGVAGHAGLFATANDLQQYALAVLTSAADRPNRKDNFTAAVDTLLTPVDVARGRRSLGWDMRTGYSRNRGDAFTEKAIGHGGFTGTVLWIDPGSDRYFIFLSNRLHPDGEGAVNSLAGDIATLLFQADPIP